MSEVSRKINEAEANEKRLIQGREILRVEAPQRKRCWGA
jgi:hypothetical protein